MRELLTNELVMALVGISVATFVGSLLLLPVVLVKVRPDYFSDLGRRAGWFSSSHPVLRVLGHVLKNTLGAALLAAGIGMLFLPGQGILTILAGVMLLDFPGKRRLELAVVRRPRVIGAVNRLRARFHRPPLLLPQPDPPASAAAGGESAGPAP